MYGVHFNSAPLPDPRIRPIKADLTDAEAVNRVVQGMDVIIQAAATTSGSKDIVGRPHIHVTDNAVMNSLILRAAYDHHVDQLIFFSCTVMYPSSETPLKESDFDAGAEIFPNYFGVGWTKVYIEKMCEFFSRLGRTRHSVIRHSNIYGPYDKYDLERSHVFGATVTKVMTNTTGELMVWGPGEEKRDLLYVDDLVDLTERMMDRQQTPFELVNAGLGHATAIKDLVARIIRISGKRIEIKHDLDKPVIPTSLTLDCDRAKEAFGWTPATSLDEGIEKTLAWYKTNLL